MSSVNHESHGYWRSLEELAGSEEARERLRREFSADDPADGSGVSRRTFLQLMSASLALAGAGCYRRREEILPLTTRPEGRVPGEPEYYATAMELGGVGRGLVVTARDGRPVKVEGNPAHPESLGATDVFSQAAILDLYDPDRLRRVAEINGGVERPRSWKDADAALARMTVERTDQSGKGVAILSEETSSPSVVALRERVLERFPGLSWYEVEPLARENERDGAILAFGGPYRTHFHFDRARVVVALDADVLHGDPASIPNLRGFLDARRPEEPDMVRLYAVESAASLTGAMADHRLPLRSLDIPVFVRKLELVVEKARKPEDVKLPGDPASSTGNAAADRFLLAVARDLVAAGPLGVLVAGPRQPPQVHAAVHRLNRILGSAGRVVEYSLDGRPQRPNRRRALSDLTRAMEAGECDALLIIGGNPVYDAPSDVPFAAALAKVPVSMHLSLHANETSRACRWQLPRAHFLEAWGDVRAWDGTVSITQPLVEPLYEGRSVLEVLSRVVGDTASGREIVRGTFGTVFAERNTDAEWRRALHDGVVGGSAWPRSVPVARDGVWGDMEPSGSLSEEVSNGELELVFAASPALYDGRFGNNAWLQELPDPVTKVTWDNAALLGPATAKTLGVESETVVSLELGGKQVEIPALVVPGMARGSVTVSVGYGRVAAGRVGGDLRRGIAPVGANVYVLRRSDALEVAGGLTVRPSGRGYPLAQTQDHHRIDSIGTSGRDRRLDLIVREGTHAEFKEDPKFARHMEHHPPLASLWESHEYGAPSWGMAIDQSRCIGCNACMVACQSENNVPVVGKEEVLRGRDMHWIRVDRYFSGDPEEPRVSFQPVTCQHCENAPCEQVCPVAATVHSDEGLNLMVYNRCVGTRYCSNNCPYKVRRFNFFDYNRKFKDPEQEVAKMASNPSVTVRSRGVMEKCTYCVQRTRSAQIRATREGRAVLESEVTPACAQACPARAITFGDLSDRRSAVRQRHEDDRAYALLAELNVKPRTRYLAKIRNPNPELVEKADGRASH